MTSRVRASDLLWYTREVLREMREHIARGVWNGAVRRGQEVIESSLKAAILHAGADYPKTHDPAPALARLLGERRVSHDAARLGRIAAVSRRLAKRRGPAGYVEVLCTEDEAREAAATAEDAFRFAAELCGEPPEGPFRPEA